MSCKDIRVCGDIVDRCTKSVDIADRHGVWEPFFFIIMCKSSQVCIEGCNLCLTFCHCLFGIIADDYKSQPWRRGDNFLGAAAHNVNLPVGDTHCFTERSRYGIDNGHDAIFLEKRTDCRNIIQHATRGVPVDNGCIFVIVMFFEEVFKFLHIESFTVISGIEFRDTTVHGNEIRESFAVYTVIQYKDMVTRFGHRSAGGLQSEDSFSAKNKSFVVGMEKTADLFTGFFVKFYEACIKIRIGAFSAAGETHVFSNLCRSRCHNFIHKINPFLNNSYFFNPVLFAATFSGAITTRVITAATPICTRFPGIEAIGASGFP